MKDCNSCGKCCIKYSDGGLSASKSEIELWDELNPEIYQYVNKGEIWFDPKTGLAIDRCPFLRLEAQTQQYSCDIYYARPDDCRLYPSNIQEMVIDECEMIETVDLKNIKAAQARLDILMADSR